MAVALTSATGQSAPTVKCGTGTGRPRPEPLQPSSIYLHSMSEITPAAGYCSRHSVFAELCGIDHHLRSPRGNVNRKRTVASWCHSEGRLGMHLSAISVLGYRAATPRQRVVSPVADQSGPRVTSVGLHHMKVSARSAQGQHKVSDRVKHGSARALN